MNEKAGPQKKGRVSEEDISILLQRYTATTVLAVLHEIAQTSDVKIDWNSLVQKTAAGISNAREYQMLWRQLAYRHSLVENLEDESEPLDDESDLEFELEAFPPVSAESSMEAAACVKVLIASGMPSESGLPNNASIEAQLTMSIPNSRSSKAPSENQLVDSSIQGTNITVSNSVQKQIAPAGTLGEGMETNGSASSIHLSRRKRKPWSEEEDLLLIAAVKKCGEGNWATILKGDFKGDRTASQLSRRWATIRKKKGSLNIGAANCNGSQLSEAQLATRRAIDMALKDPLTASCAGNGAAGSSNPPTPTEDSLVVNPTASKTTLALPAKPRPSLKKMPTVTPESMVKATAVAAGARIASPSDAATIFKVAQAKNVVHIMPVGSGGSLSKYPEAGSGIPLPSTHLPGHPNVHYFRTGMTTATPPSPMAAGCHQVRANMVISAAASVVPPESVEAAATCAPTMPLQQTAVASPAVLSQSVKAAATPTTIMSSEQPATSMHSPSIETEREQDIKTAKAIIASIPNTKPNMVVKEDPDSVSVHASGEQLEKDQSMFLLPKVEEVFKDHTYADSESLQSNEIVVKEN
ncbi:hypothetical protein Nepgr_024170 [Nepenthes gracilis]|uniref:Uncharacterized protein n=1 Tax=Nepenthes gracilis TaxID=150966 RepID=A0AAD3T452_NEPGR|nr:hypothetical protein Nepgr_024170 [Nepenthes gracilis]